MEPLIIFPESSAFYSEKFCKISKTLFRKCFYPQLLHSSINFIELFFLHGESVLESRYLSFLRLISRIVVSLIVAKSGCSIIIRGDANLYKVRSKINEIELKWKREELCSDKFEFIYSK